jgi:hypothetical protein
VRPDSDPARAAHGMAEHMKGEKQSGARRGAVRSGASGTCGGGEACRDDREVGKEKSKAERGEEPCVAERPVRAEEARLAETTEHLKWVCCLEPQTVQL